MEVLDFINTHKENWEELLTQSPYNIKVKRDGKYVLLQYSQFESDFTNEIVRECRGAIFYELPKNVGWICVCRAFDKFANYGEGYAADIDWNSVIVEEKVDGSLIKLFYHNNKWNIATNRTIDAFQANVNSDMCSFGMLVYEALGGEYQFNQFTELLDQECTYMFELVSPKSRLTIYYPETKLYYLGQRNIISMREYKLYTDFMESYGILCPHEYNLNSLNDCLEYVKTMTKDEEGFVVRDKDFNRIKIKSPEFLFAFHCDNNGVITTRRIIDMIKEEKIDDFLAYCPQHTDMVNEVIHRIDMLQDNITFEWKLAEPYSTATKKNFAQLVDDYKYKDFLFKKYDNHDLKALDYIMLQRTDKIKEMIERM